MTRVDEWTRADTGVGAAMAAGSQAEKGIWALLVKAPNATAPTAHLERGLSLNKGCQEPLRLTQAIATTIHTSPTRFLRAVRRAALADLVLP